MDKKIKKYLKLNIEAQLKNFDIGGAIVIAGKPGIGKTATLKMLAKELDLHFLHISIPELTPEELSGIPEFSKAPELKQYNLNDDTNSSLATIWSASQLIYRANTLANSSNKKGVLLTIDDLHKINMATAPYLYSLLGERKLGEFLLDDRVAIVGAMNDSEEAGFDGLESPIKDRIGILKVTFDFDYWYKLIGIKLNPFVSSFLKTRPELIIEEESTEIEQFATPRSWTFLSKEIEYIFSVSQEEFFFDNVFMIASQKISIETSREFAKHTLYIKSLDIKNIVEQRKVFNAKTLKVLDQIIYSFLINYIDSLDDAKYLVKLLKKNIAVENFVGSLIVEAYNRYQRLVANKSIQNSQGLEIFVDHILGNTSEDIHLSEEESGKLLSVVTKSFNLF
ncbi:MAG: ATP-binding protein [Sulfurimonas sp.]|nr:ATP-binding protein [Sulfurimonas sp.]